VVGLIASVGVARAQAAEPEPAPESQPELAPEPVAPTAELPADGEDKKPRRWITDVGGGVPILESGAFKVVANAMVGYRWKKLELLASGAINQYASASDNVFNNTTHAGWQLHGAYATGSPGDRLRWMFVQDLAQTLYLTRYVELSSSTPGQLRDFNLNIKNEDSHMLRGSGLVGFLYASPRTQARVALGLGLQAEFYLMTWFMTGSAGTEAAFKVDVQLSAREQGHVQARHQLLPGKLALRLYSDWSTFTLSRSSAAVTIDFSKFSDSQASASLFRYRQIEASNRIALDLERYTYRGLMPSIFAGLDLSLLRADIGNSTAIVPVLGIGFTNGQL